MSAPQDMTREEIALLAWAQLSEYVNRYGTLDREGQRAVRDALCNAAADIHAAGVRL